MTDYSDLSMPGLTGDFTMTLGRMLSLGYDTDDRLHLDPVHYPIFDEGHRADLNHKIVAHYAMREIGQETPMQFVFYLGRTMNEIMPYYNQLYMSEAKKYDPLLTTDMSATANSSSTSESSGKQSADQSTRATGSSSSKTSTDVDAVSFHSENPQTQSSFEDNATTADRTKSNTTATTQGEQSSDNESTSHSSTDFTHASDNGETVSHTKGFSGASGAQLITEWRRAMLNIDLLVIQELEPCFMTVWGTADTMHSTQLGKVRI